MKQLFTLFIFLLSLNINAQKKLTNQEISIKLDSIKAEGNLLYSLENASWNATDIAFENKNINHLVGGFLTYKVDDIVKTVFIDKKGNKIVAEYSFKNNSKNPFNSSEIERDLLPIEKDLNNARQNLIIQLSDSEYEIGAPEGFNLNIVTIPFENKYKHYIITGATEFGVIPFGNDYLFISDKEGKIIKHTKFHSRLIPTYTSDVKGNVVTKIFHSHLRSNPFISATDICTFKLYAPFSNLEKFSVYSPEFETSFEYDYINDTLILTD